MASKSRAERYRIEAHLELLGWRPVRVAQRGVYAPGYGVQHADTKMLTYRAGPDHYIYDCPFAHRSHAYIADSNWVQLSGGLFWTIVDWFERKGCWDGYEPTTSHGGNHPAPWMATCHQVV